jgi:hypothetical protein
VTISTGMPFLAAPGVEIGQLGEMIGSSSSFTQRHRERACSRNRQAVVPVVCENTSPERLKGLGFVVITGTRADVAAAGRFLHRVGADFTHQTITLFA